jgi:hypothetical protein
MLEKTVKRAVKDQLDMLGAFHHWPVQMGIGAACLDCHGCYQGRYFAIETKAPGKTPTARQELTIAAIRAAGGLVLVIDTVEQARALLNKAFFTNLITSGKSAAGAAQPGARPVPGGSDPAA